MSTKYIIGGHIIVDCENGILTRSETHHTVSLGKKPADLLRVLIERQGEVYTVREMVSDELERKRVITPASITQYVSKIRRAFRAIGYIQPVIITSASNGYFFSEEITVQRHEENNSARAEINEATPELPLPQIDVRTTTAGPKKHPWPFIIISLFIIANLIYLPFTHRLSSPPREEEKLYPRMLVKDNCHYFSHIDSKKVFNDAISLISRDVSFDCQKYPWQYLTYYENKPHYFYLSCEGPIESVDSSRRCISVMRFNYVRQ